MIRVFVVDDSQTVRAKLIEILSAEADIHVVGEAANGRDAITQLSLVRPDVITLDLAIPDIDGLGVTEHVMAAMPTPILIVSSSFNRGEVFSTYEALSAGAVDVLDKSRDLDDVEWDARFVSAVRMVSRIKVITHPRGRLRSMERSSGKHGALARKPELLAIGASTGGPGAILDVLAPLPKPFPLPIVVVLHVDPAFAISFTDWLAARTGREVRLGEQGDILEPGVITFAPPHKHMTIHAGRVRLVDSAPRHHCRPSIDVLLESIAAPTTLGVLLTGMGRDGALGLLAIRRAGGLTIAQDEATSVVYGMPREAALIGGVDRVLPLGDIGPAITTLVEVG